MGVLKKVSFISALCECFLKLQRGEKKVNSVLGDERLLRYMRLHVKQLEESNCFLSVRKMFEYHETICGEVS